MTFEELKQSNLDVSKRQLEFISFLEIMNLEPLICDHKVNDVDSEKYSISIYVNKFGIKGNFELEE